MPSFTEKQIFSLSVKRVTATSFVLFLIVLFLISFRFIEVKIRDSKRMADLKNIVQALDIYYDRFHKYPDNQDQDWAGWDATYEPHGQKEFFIPELLSQGILKKIVKDPLNNAAFYYRYQKFPAGSYGCQRAFFILQAVNFESNVKNHGLGSCPEKNWVEELDNGYTIQKFE